MYVTTLAGSDLVFFDPDNSLLVKPVDGRSTKNSKLFHEEAGIYIVKGRSVVVYNQRRGKKPSVYFGQIHCALHTAVHGWRGVSAITSTGSRLAPLNNQRKRRTLLVISYYDKKT